MNKPFGCYQCGACCKLAGFIPNFPEPTDTTGRCKHLKDDMTCAIYDTRPDICRVDKQYKEEYGDWDSFCEENLKLCKVAEMMVEKLKRRKDNADT